MKKCMLSLMCLLMAATVVLGISQPVNAAVQPTKTFTDCPTYDELHDAVVYNHVLNFELAKACTVSFEREIVIENYAVIRNVGEGTLTFEGNRTDGDDDNDSIFFSVSSGTLELNNIILKNGYGVNGGALVVTGGNLVLDHVTLKNNMSSASGGAIYFSSGDMEIRDSSFIDNTTESDNAASSGSGGAIYVRNFASVARVFILNSTFDGNKTGDSSAESSGRGGAIYVYDVDGSMLVNIFNSTFYGNSTGNSLMNSVGDGGAIYANNYDGSASVNIYHSTFSQNATGTTWSGTPGDGQTIFLRNAALNMAGSIMGNSVSSYGGNGNDCDFYGDVSISDGGYNIIENMGDCRDYFPRSTEVDPDLNSTLAANGGTTQTIALNSSSQAVDQIPVGTTVHAINLCGYDYADYDQRGEARPGNAACDIGAYEIVDENHPYTLPSTGFPQGLVTQLSAPSVEYQALSAQGGGMQLVIPTLGINSEVVGVPDSEEGWNVDWLGEQVGYLHGTSFPTWQGNTVLTGHSYNQLGQKGIFADLENLGYNDLITIQAWGQEYVYAVQEHYVTNADDLSVLSHSELNQLTLVTCTGYDPITMNYPLREVVVAILVVVR